MADVTESTAPPAEKMLELFVRTMSGKSATLSTRTSASPMDVCVIIEDLLGVAANSQDWLVGSDEVPLFRSLTMADTGLQSGAQLTVMHSGTIPLAPLPDAFTLDLTSIRQQLRARCSSDFSIAYNIKASIPGGWMYCEPWRILVRYQGRYTHDRHLYDIKADTHKTETSHWLCGLSMSKQPLLGKDPLSAFCTAWSSPPTRLPRDVERFWRLASMTSENQDKDVDVNMTRKRFLTHPDYNAVPGWFTAPSEDCDEVEMDVPLPLGTRIIRLLLDETGKPLRAAVKGCKMGMMHQDLEEYEIKLEVSNDSKPDFHKGTDGGDGGN